MTKFLVLFAVLALIAISISAPTVPKAVVVTSSAKKVEIGNDPMIFDEKNAKIETKANKQK